MVADDGMGMSFDMEHERDRLPRNYEEEPTERERIPPSPTSSQVSWSGELDGWLGTSFQIVNY